MGKVYLGIGILILLLQVSSFAQDDNELTTNQLVGSEQTLDYAVSFLTIATDSRAGAMGDVGAATSPDINSMHWNPAKYAFIKNDMGIAVSYTPWLRQLVDDINLGYLTFYKRIDDQQVFSASLLYFGLGSITFTNEIGEYNGEHMPYELSVDASYSRKFTENLSGGLAFRYIRSDLTGGAMINGTYSKAANTAAADVAIYYINDNMSLSDMDGDLSLGLNIRNIGAKISYTETEKDFLPTELRLGLAYKTYIDDYNSFTVAFDVSKFLVPTTPLYQKDSLNTNFVYDTDGNKIILEGRNPEVSVVQGMVQSFYDAPNGFTEELHELKYGIGLEYYYMNLFAVRGGYFHEHQNKGNRKYFTAGIGLKLNVFNIDFSYLIPVKQNNPLANTVRFTLGFDFDAFSAQQRNRNF